MKDEENKKKLYMNRFGAYSNPTRTLEELMLFISSPTALEETIDYISFDPAIETTSDIMAGLDAAIESEDRNMIAYYKKYIKGGHH